MGRMRVRRFGAAAITILIGALAALAQEPSSAAHIRINVDVVQTPVSVTRRGVPVKGLTQEDFQIRENGSTQVVKYFWQELDLPLSVGLIVDVSASQAGLIGQHRETVTKFLRQVLGPRDKAMLMTVGAQARLISDFTSSVEEFGKGIDRIKMGNEQSPILGEPCHGTRRKLPRILGRRRVKETIPCGGTALWQGVYWAAHLKMRGIEGRKALIVLSDGIDTGSDYNLEDAIEAAQAAETPVYTIKFFSAITAPLLPLVALKRGMERLGDETGGVAFGILHGDMGKVFEQIEQDLRNLYVLGYTPTNTARDGKFRRIEVTTTMKDAQVRTRKGYLAARD